MTCKLRVAVFYDGRPGHEKQTEGILKALSEFAELEVQNTSLERPSVIVRLQKVCRLFLPTLKVADSSLDLVIGAGATTHLDILLRKKATGAKAVTCMLPDSYLRGFFDLCFVPAHDGIKGGDAIFSTFGAPNGLENRRAHQHDHGLILLGGVDQASHYWNDEEVCRNVETIVRSEKNIQWTISTSPRTPEKTTSLLQKIAESYGHANFFSFLDTPRGWVENQYHENATTWVTVDSISMVYEALSAGCNVGILPLRWKNSSSKFAYNERLLLENLLVTSYAEWLRTGCMRQQTPAANFNEARRCAQHIMDLWWPKK